jgi:hypothetical protein
MWNFVTFVAGALVLWLLLDARRLLVTLTTARYARTLDTLHPVFSEWQANQAYAGALHKSATLRTLEAALPYDDEFHAEVEAHKISAPAEKRMREVVRAGVRANQRLFTGLLAGQHG